MGIPGLLVGSHSGHQLSPMNPQVSRNIVEKSLVLDQELENYSLQRKFSLQPHPFVYILSLSSIRN